MCGLPLGFLFVPLIYIFVFVTVPYCLDNCSFVVYPDVRKVDSYSSIVLSQHRFGYLGSFVCREQVIKKVEKCLQTRLSTRAEHSCKRDVLPSVGN